MNNMSIKGNKGVTLIALTLTIILILVITSATIFGTKNNISIKRLQKLRADIEILNSKIDEYYLTYGDLPKLCDYCNKNEFKALLQARCNDTTSALASEPNVNDGEKYIVIDLEKLGGLTLNYGYETNGDYYKVRSAKAINDEEREDEIYVINTTTHQIYFPHGIFVDNIMHYSI